MVGNNKNIVRILAYFAIGATSVDDWDAYVKSYEEGKLFKIEKHTNKTFYDAKVVFLLFLVY